MIGSLVGDCELPGAGYGVSASVLEDER